MPDIFFENNNFLWANSSRVAVIGFKLRPFLPPANFELQKIQRFSFETANITDTVSPGTVLGFECPRQAYRGPASLAHWLRYFYKRFKDGQTDKLLIFAGLT